MESIFQSLSEKPFESYKTEDFEENQPLIVIHCEFSQKRGPKLIRYLRKRDREINEDNYPNLIYPNVFLLKGGYSEFVKNNSVLFFFYYYFIIYRIIALIMEVMSLCSMKNSKSNAQKKILIIIKCGMKSKMSSSSLIFTSHLL